jgi:putative ABC transport system permease protein
MDTLLQDLRYACRSFLSRPGFSALMVACLALGIGVNSTIFSVVDTVSIRPLPFRTPDELVALHTTRLANGIQRGSVSYLDYQSWKTETQSFAAMAGVSGRTMTVTDRDESERFLGALVTWNLFPLLGIDPVLGRPFREDEDQPGAAPVVLLSHGLWQRKFLGDPSIVGRPITVNGAARTVVGIMPEQFQFPQFAQLWIPLVPIEQASDRNTRNLLIFARMKPSASLENARRDMSSVADRLASSFRENDGWSATAITMRDELMPTEIKLMVTTMMGAVSLVLLIACANVANLLLARATARQREIAVRTALGAGRGRIVRQLLTESVLIALASAPFGILLTIVGLRWLTAAIPPEGQPPYYVNWDMSWRIVFYTGVTSALTGIIFGLAPAFHAADSDLHGSLKEGGRGSGGSARRNRIRNALVVAEIALSLVLLVGASLFVRSFLNLRGADGGLNTASLMTLRFSLASENYQSEDAKTRRVEDIIRRVEALPGVEAAFASNLVPFSGGGGGGGVEPEGRIAEAGKEPQISFVAASPHLMRTLNMPIVAGRDFRDDEGSSRSRVAIVNRVLARYLWPDRDDVVGLRFRFTSGTDMEWITIVGVVGDFNVFSVRSQDLPKVAFVAYPYMAVPNTGLTIRVADGVPPASITAQVREEFRKSDPFVPLFNIRTGEENRLFSFWQDRLFGWMFTIFGAVALLLATVGIYGVLSYSVEQRTQEIGIRVALGASRREVFQMILRQSAVLAGAGIVIGAIGAGLVTPFVRSILYNVTPTDPLSFVSTAVFLVLIAILAGILPARRATSVDPIIALRSE